MSGTSYLRGHRILNIEGKWVYADTKEPTAGSPRNCGYCFGPDREDGHDSCLGELPGIRNACCGHGVESGAYVQFLDGSILRGNDATIVLGVIKAQP